MLQFKSASVFSASVILHLRQHHHQGRERERERSRLQTSETPAKEQKLGKKRFFCLCYLGKESAQKKKQKTVFESRVTSTLPGGDVQQLANEQRERENERERYIKIYMDKIGGDTTTNDRPNRT